MFEARADVDVDGVAGVDAADAPALTAPPTINARKTVTIGCRRDRLWFAVAG
jgi:hypothetical protein